MTDHEAIALTSSERRAFSALPREADVSSEAEERTVRALRNAGLLGRRKRPGGTARVLVQMAAGLMLFAAGLIVGSYDDADAGISRDPDVVSEVRRTGEGFLAALDGAVTADLSSASADSAAGSAVATLRSAVGTLPRLGVLTAAAMDLQMSLASREGVWTVDEETVIWF